MEILKQSTTADVILGPFLDDTDGKTPETGLTIAQSDVQLMKNGGAAAQKNDASSATHRTGGQYSVPLDATDTGTIGRLRMSVQVSGALPEWKDCMVIDGDAYDALYAGTTDFRATLPKNAAFTFVFDMYDSSGDPKTGLTVTAQRSIDGGAFGACANSVSEIANGFYSIALAAADLNGDMVALKFTATGAKQRNILVRTQG